MEPRFPLLVVPEVDVELMDDDEEDKGEGRADGVEELIGPLFDKGIVPIEEEIKGEFEECC